MPAITLDSRTARHPRKHREQRLGRALGGALPAAHARLRRGTAARALGRVAEEPSERSLERRGLHLLEGACI
jgi:hypothetical protein